MENERIIQTVRNLFAGVDERNWQMVEKTLAERVLLDYTSMAGGQPAQLTPTQITDTWAAFLPGFDRTNHQLSQFEVKQQAKVASAHYLGKAEHFIGKEIWIVEGSYDTELIKENQTWLITRHRFNFTKQSGNIDLPAKATERMKNVGLIEQNRKVVENFFVALETQKFDMLKDVFAENGRQVNPYSPAGFPKSFDGAEGIYRQYSGLTAHFGRMKFPRKIFATEDPNFFFVQFRGEIEIKAGGRYENDYLGTFRLENGKVVEYTEYFNQIVMAKAFGIELK